MLSVLHEYGFVCLGIGRYNREVVPGVFTTKMCGRFYCGRSENNTPVLAGLTSAFGVTSHFVNIQYVP